MKIDYDGQVYEFDSGNIDLQQGMVIQLHTGMSIAGWENSLNVSEDKPPGPEWLKAVQSLFWAVLAQNGVTMPIADANPKIGKFLAAYGAAMAAGETASAPAEPDPTPAPPSPPAVPPSQGPSSRPDMTLTPPGQEAPSPATGS